jgi:hypothetical protein
MEVALTIQGAIDQFSAEPKLIIALFASLILLAVLSRQLLSFLGSSLLAIGAFSIFEFPGSLPTILIIMFAAGSVLVSFAGMDRRRQLNKLRRELTRLSIAQTKLETAESRRVLADIKSTYSARHQPTVIDYGEAGQNVPGPAAVNTHASAF